MTEHTEIAETQATPDPFFVLLDCFDRGLTADQVALATQLQTVFKDDPPEDDKGRIVAAITELLLEIGLANQSAMSRQAFKAVGHFEQALELIKALPPEIAEIPDFYFRLRSIQLQARVSGPLSEVAERVLLGSIDAANTAAQKATAHARELAGILSPSAEEHEHALRPLAAVLFATYVSAVSGVHMVSAAQGKRLKLATKFFEDTQAQIDGFAPVDFEGLPYIDDLLSAFSRQSHAANIRVNAEIAVQEGRYADALALYDDAILAFSEAAQKLPVINDNPQVALIVNQTRDALGNQPAVLGQSIRLVSKLKAAQDELAVLSDQHADRAEQFDKLQAFHRQAMSDFANRELPITVNTNVSVENQIKNEMNFRQELVMSAQDTAMDEVLKLLRKLDPSDEVTALEEEARKTKAEPDMAAKIEKAAKVVDAASKIVEGAAKIVPYGTPVLAVLKGLYAGWRALSAPQETDPGPSTKLV
ncbi:MAG: hypothetical protein AAF700_13405 [Pseudomonadota bacterium]